MIFKKCFWEIVEDYLGVHLDIKVKEIDLVELIVKEVNTIEYI